MIMWQSNPRISSEKNSWQICKPKVGGPALKIRIKFHIDAFDTVRINVELQSLWESVNLFKLLSKLRNGPGAPGWGQTTRLISSFSPAFMTDIRARDVGNYTITNYKLFSEKKILHKF